LLTPRDLSRSTTEQRFARWISGTVFSSISSSKASRVKRRKHLPGATRPARPARCCAEALEMGATVRLSMPAPEPLALYALDLQKPGSTTKVMPSMVSDVSAMLVASTTLRAPSGVGSKMRACSSEGRFA
jgi:hypothetical protein